MGYHLLYWLVAWWPCFFYIKPREFSSGDHGKAWKVFLVETRGAGPSPKSIRMGDGAQKGRSLHSEMQKMMDDLRFSFYNVFRWILDGLTGTFNRCMV